MIIKIRSDDPLFHQSISLLKLKYRTTAASKAAKLAIYEINEIERENEILNASVQSLEDEVERLRSLLDVMRSTKVRTFVRNIRK